jgi:hypothetical protein
MHFRRAFETHGLPEAVWTDGLSLIGASSGSGSLWSYGINHSWKTTAGSAPLPLRAC